jgi:hypothetical protein
MADATDFLQTISMKLESNYEIAGGRVGALPPGIWAALLQAALAALQAFLGGGAGGLCPVAPTPAGVIAGAKANTLGAYLFVRRQIATPLREDYGLGAFLKFNGDAMCRSVLATAGSATEEEVVQVAGLAN